MGGVTFPTHQRGHTLDLALCRRDDEILQSTDADYTLDQSNRYCVVSQLRLSSIPRPPVYVEARKLSAVDLTTFKADLQAKLLASPQLSADQLHHFLQEQMDQHAHATQSLQPSSFSLVLFN